MSIRDSWATPDYIFDPLDHEFGFTIDVCATKDNAKIQNWIELPNNALELCWRYGDDNNNWDQCVAWCNPPYSDVAPWIAKAIEQARCNNVTTVMLTNYIVDCAYFHEHLPHIEEIRLALTRIQFEPPESVESSSNSKPQQLTIITPESAKAHGTPRITLWANGKKPKG